jgi:hypothetical protein
MKKQCDKMFKKYLAVFCLVLCLVTVFGAAEKAQAMYGGDPDTWQISGTITRYEYSPTLTNAYFIASYEGGGSNAFIKHIEGVFAANDTKTFSFNTDKKINNYTIIGLYNTGYDSVTVGMKGEAVDALSNTNWNDVFKVPASGLPTEANTAAWIMAGCPKELVPANVPVGLADVYGSKINEKSYLIDFSQSIKSGEASATATPVPLPPSLLLLCSGLIGAVLFRRRIRSTI